MVRKTPDIANFTTAQHIYLAEPATATSKLPKAPPCKPYFLVENSLRPAYPRGFFFKFQLNSTWGNEETIGVDDLILLDVDDKPIPVHEVGLYIVCHRRSIM